MSLETRASRERAPVAAKAVASARKIVAELRDLAVFLAVLPVLWGLLAVMTLVSPVLWALNRRKRKPAR